MTYVEVGVGVERHWKSAIFTYTSEAALQPGDIVRVPFGKKKKPGVVLKVVKKPTFETKPIYEKLPMVFSDQTRDFMDWFQGFYQATDGETYSQFLPGYVTSSKKNDSVADATGKTTIPKLQLNASQKRAVKHITETDGAVVLQGITGSGKTRVYIELLLETLASGQNALVLYPEIALTNQLVSELSQHAPVLTFHSHLTQKQRSDLWLQVALSQEPVIVAGPRSALFLPHQNLGLIVVDEAHETSFKQESDVRYNGILVAGGLAKIHQAKLVLGSATPPITETELILRSGGSMIDMPEKAIKTTYTKQLDIISLKDTDQFKKHPLLSDKLLASIQQSLKLKKQSLLFLNRRGTAKLLLCEACGWQAECPNCDLPMTYHHDVHRMICHTCGKRMPVPTACPECGQHTKMKSLGSKALVEEVQKLFPDAVIGRFDSDTTKKESFSERYEEVRSGAVDILIGTQQLAKGLDLPQLRTVGVLQADLSLHFPDFSSNERTFQLLSQVFGRAGRGHGDAEIFVQTHQPDNPIISLAIEEDWPAFRTQELAQRQLHAFPPTVFAAKLIARESSYEKAHKTLQKARGTIEKLPVQVTIDGPLASFYGKRGGFYYAQLHLRAKKRSDLLKACHDLPPTILKDFDPITLL